MIQPTARAVVDGRSASPPAKVGADNLEGKHELFRGSVRGAEIFAGSRERKGTVSPTEAIGRKP
jgi:hypothetical protein